jgi:hypothetical protein
MSMKKNINPSIAQNLQVKDMDLVRDWDWDWDLVRD